MAVKRYNNEDLERKEYHQRESSLNAIVFLEHNRFLTDRKIYISS